MIQTAALRTIVAGFAGQVALIVGDVMLDEYIWGDVRRISPEAPVPVVQTKRRTHRPGGAGNVAANVAALAGTPLLCGVVGDDAMAEYLASALREAGVAEVGGLLQAPGQPTTVKSRIMAHSQQMLRLDTEIGQPQAGDAEEHVLAWCAHAITRAGACIISDYAKGVLTSR